MNSAFVRKTISVTAFVLVTCVIASMSAQTPSPSGTTTTQKSVGRGWPVPVALKPFHGFPKEEFVGAVTPWYYETSTTATGGKPPAGVEPLPRDAGLPSAARDAPAASPAMS